MNHLVGIPTVSFLEGLFRDSHPILLGIQGKVRPCNWRPARLRVWARSLLRRQANRRIRLPGGPDRELFCQSAQEFLGQCQCWQCLLSRHSQVQDRQLIQEGLQTSLLDEGELGGVWYNSQDPVQVLLQRVRTGNS